MTTPLTLSFSLRRRLLICVASVFVACSVAFSVPATASEPDVMAAAAGSSWSTETQPDLAAFNHWAQRRADAKASAAQVDAADLAEGVRLARARFAALAGMVHTDPARVIAAGVPATVRSTLPVPILAELETPFSAVGDYTDYCELRAMIGPRVAPSRREVKFDGRVHPAYVYGRRAGMTTKRNLFLHGVLVGNDAVLDENVLRVLPADEAARDTRAPRDLSAPVGTTLAPSTSGPVLAEAGGKLYRFVSDAHVRHAEASLRLLEAHRTPETSDAAEPQALENPASIPAVPDSAYTTGAKKVLVIRVDFSDFAGDPTFRGGSPDTASYCQGLVDNHVKPYYIHSSYNLTDLNTTVTSQLYRMPRTASDYATNGDNTGLHTDAETLASADYDLSTFDRLIVVFSFLGDLSGSQITYGGLAQVGASRLWVNGEFDFRVVAHELGHTYGLIHGNLWQISDGNPASLSGSTTEYGDIFDTMGANFANSEGTDFNAWYKTQLDWLPASQVQNVTASGTYRIYRFDDVSASNVVALKVVKDGTRNYWVSARRSYTSNDSMTHGVYVTWGYNNDYTQHNVLDTQTPGNDVTDAALPTGSAFSDSTAAITITALDEGGTAPALYEDVRIDVDTNGTSPVVNSAANSNGTAGTAYSYQIGASNSPTSYSATGLPPGLSVNTSTGAISGTPSTPGTYSALVSAFNANGTGSAPVNMTIGTSANAPTITSFSPTAGPVGTTVTINGTNFNSLQGISFGGGVYASGSYTATQITATVPSGAVTGPITVYTANGNVSTTTNFTVGAQTSPVITSPTTATATQGKSFSYQITATNSPTSYAASGLPSGLTINTSTGVISGTPKNVGKAAVTISATNASGTGTGKVTITITAPPVITSATTASATQGTAFSYQITATNSPTSYGATGLPSGLTINTSSGLISGTPKNTGTAAVTITATNAAGTGTGKVTITIKAATPVITSATTASATQGASFTYQITATNSPTSYAASGLPSGLTINTSTGVISGTPKNVGKAAVTISATNGSGTGTGKVTITITAPPVITSAATASATQGEAFTYQITATNDPTSYAATGLPTGLSINTATGVISGTPKNQGTAAVKISATNATGTGTGKVTITINGPGA